MAFYRACCGVEKLCLLVNKHVIQQGVNKRLKLLQILQTKQELGSIVYLQYHTTNHLYKRRRTAEERKSSRIIEYSPKAKSEVVEVWRDITIRELSTILKGDTQYISDLFLNEFRGANTVISDLGKLQDAIRRSGRRMRVIGKPSAQTITEDQDVYPQPMPAKEFLVPRPPVVTVMGHVDHGKTTLLDALRQTSVVDQEFGGITQHIGAFSVLLKNGAKITFLDTPGHAAFTAMRERGANITDIVVLVVAADDGVMEQTIESVRMARQANVPILVAINKIDAPNADIDRTEQMLMQIGIQVEKHGGDVQAIPISAKKKQNLEALTEALVLQAELLELGSDPKGTVEAVVVESKLHPHRGKLSTVVVQRGTLKRGNILVADTCLCKVRLLRAADGTILDKVEPGYPAEIEGWRDLPASGDVVLQVPSEQKGRDVIKTREHKKFQEKSKDIASAIAEKTEAHQREYQERLAMKRRMGRYKLRATGPRQKELQPDDGHPALNLVIKADVNGTLEAILNTLDTYDLQDCEMDLVHYGVGPVSESDVELAKSFNGIIYAFNVDCPQKIADIASNEAVIVKSLNVIYKLVDDVKQEINNRLPLKEVEEIIGEATVLQQFDINEGKKKIPVAGSRCVKGQLKRNALYRLMRNDEVLYDGTLSSMRHLKSEVDSIKTDLECGLQLSDKNIDFQQGDKLVCYEKRKVPQQTTWDPGF